MKRDVNHSFKTERKKEREKGFAEAMVRTRASTSNKRKSPSHVSTIDNGRSFPSPTLPWLVPGSYSSNAQRTRSQQVIVAVQAEVNDIQSSTHAPNKAFDLPPASSTPLARYKTPKVAIRGKLIKNMSDSTIKDEDDPIETHQQFETETLTPAQEEPRVSTTYTENPTPCVSLNLTTMADVADDESDGEEFISAFNPDFVVIDGYKVRTEFGSVLEEIISKNGDIALSCFFESDDMRSKSLEVVCEIVQSLRKMSFVESKPQDLKMMLQRIDDLEKVGMRVGWLRNRVAEIYEAKAKFNQIRSIKLAKTRNKEASDETEKAISMLMEKREELKAESEMIRSNARDIISTVKCFYKRSLLEGLL